VREDKARDEERSHGIEQFERALASRAEDEAEREDRAHQTMMQELAIRQRQALRAYDHRAGTMAEKNQALQAKLTGLQMDERVKENALREREEGLKDWYDTQFAEALSQSEEHSREWETKRLEVQASKNEAQRAELTTLEQRGEESIIQLDRALKEEQEDRRKRLALKRRLVGENLAKNLAKKEVEIDMLSETFVAMKREMDGFESVDVSLLGEQHSQKEEQTMLRLEKQLARYLLMTEGLLEEFGRLEQDRIQGRFVGFEANQAHIKAKEEGLLAKLEAACDDFVGQSGRDAERSREDLKQGFRREVCKLERNAERDLHQISTSHEHYEEACRVKYGDELTAQQTRDDDLRRSLTKDHSDELSLQSRRQHDRAAMFETVRSEASDSVGAKYDRILKELAVSWERESEARDGAFVTKSRVYWEEHAKAVQRQLDLTQRTLHSIEHHDLIDWENEKDRVLDAEDFRKSTVERTERQIFEDERRILEEQLETRRKMAVDALEEAGASVEGHVGEEQLELLFAQALETEKHKYEERWEDQWRPIESTVRELETMYEVEANWKEEDCPEEEKAVSTVVAVHEAGLNARSPRSPAFSIADHGEKVALGEAVNALQHVWFATETPVEQSIAFLETVTHSLPQTQSLQWLFEAEAAKLEERRAIRGMLVKRDGLLEAVVRARAQGGDDSRRHFKEVKSRGEIQQLDETLQKYIPLYQNKHREVFMHQGRPVLEKIKEDQEALFGCWSAPV